MYGYQPIVPNDLSSLLVYYRQEEIFKIVFGYYPVVNQYVKSPFRKDRNPNCYFEWVGNQLLFTDFGDNTKYRGCIKAVKDYFNLPDYRSTTEFIVNYFESNKPLLSPVNHDIEYERKRAEITFKSKPFDNSRDRLFWTQFEITRSNLIEDNVFSVLFYRINSAKKKSITVYRPMDICYAICGFANRVKIYRPTAKGKAKWATTCTQDDVGGMSNLPLASSVLIITKSYKDYRVIRNQGYNVVWFQNEGMFPDDAILYDLSIRFERIFILFDNDRQGIEASDALITKFKSLNKEDVFAFQSPYWYLKDPAEIISVKGKDELNMFLWNNCQI